MRITPSLLALSLVLPFSLAAAGCAPHTVAVMPEQLNALTVSGEGEATAPPDLGTVRLGVEERAPSAQDAMTQANARMAAIIDAVKAQGVAAKDLQTSDLSMYFEMYPDMPPVPLPRPEMEAAVKEKAVPESMPATVGPRGQYVVRNTVVVSVRDLDKIGSVIGSAMQAGANNLHGFELSIEDPKKLAAEARQKAVEEAKQKATQLAKEAGVKLGPVLSISEQGAATPYPMPMAASYRMKDAAQAVPVEHGQLSVSQSVQVVFAIEK